MPSKSEDEALQAPTETGVLTPARSPGVLPRIEDLPEGNLSVELEDMRDETGRGY